MKIFFSLLIALISFSGLSQETIKQIDTTTKTILINPLPIEIYNHLQSNGTGIEVTGYTSSKTFSLPQKNGTRFFLSLIQGKSTVDFNPNNMGYIMILADNDFYMEAEISLSEKNNYIVFKKDGKKYYNLLNQKGIDFFYKNFDIKK